MSRLRSPAHPNSSLPDAVEYARKIHDRERRNPVSREVAVQHMGFSGISGSSDRALATVLHYGLAEKVAKGEVRVSDMAVSILHPNSPDEFRQAIREAAFNPSFFAELRRRYPDEPPSVSSLSSFLSRSGFAAAAIGPAAKAYIETCQYLRQERAYDSDVPTDQDEPESAASLRLEPKPMHSSVVSAHPAPAVVQFAGGFELNEPSLDIRGREVTIQARLDLAGLKQLRQKLEWIEKLLTPMEDDKSDNSRNNDDVI